MGQALKNEAAEGLDSGNFDERGPLLDAAEFARPGAELDLRPGNLREEIVR